MAEIKSTMEMVLARAEKLCADSAPQADDDALHAGMKAGAAFLKDNSINFSDEISKYKDAQFSQFTEGLLQTLLRNITLPKDDEKPWENAMNGLAELAKIWPTGNPSDQLASYIKEVSSILGRYNDHRQQIKSQLEEHFAAQAAQLQANLAQQTGMNMNIPPSQHPKFQEEWQKAVGQMNDQYLSALEQYKEAITQLFIAE